MKKTIKFFAAALAIVAAASCEKEIATNDTLQTPETDQELVHKVFSASLNVDEKTKTTLHTDGKTVHWTDGDKIKVIPANAYNGNDFNVVSIDGTFADFEGETVDADSYRAVYPATAYYTAWSYDNYCVFSDGTAALKTQYAVENNFSLSSFNTSSNFAVSTTSKENHLYFKNINAYFKLSLSMDNAAAIEISSDKAEGSVELSANYDLGGALNYRYAENKAYLSSNHSIVFKTKDNSNLKSGVTYYIAVPAVQVEGLKLAVKDANGTEITSFTKSSFTFEQNKIYNLGVIEAKKSYSVVKQLSHATELEDGKLYVISYMKDTKMFWSEQEQWLKLATLSSGTASNNEYEINNVFKFHKTSSTASIGNYNTTIVGMWESLSNGKYMSSNPAMNGTSSDASYISIGQWDGRSKDFDIYIGTSSGSVFYYNGTRVAAGSTTTAESNGRGQEGRKWYIYEVKEN